MKILWLVGNSYGMHVHFSFLQLDDCALQLSHNGSYLDLDSTLAEQKDELEGFQEDGG